MVTEGFLEELAITQRSSGREGARHMQIWAKGIPGREVHANSPCPAALSKTLSRLLS